LGEEAEKEKRGRYKLRNDIYGRKGKGFVPDSGLGARRAKILLSKIANVWGKRAYQSK